MGKGRRVVVTGLGVATPLGIGMEQTWEGLLAKTCAIRPITAFDPAGFPARIAGELPAFSLGDYIPKAYRKSAKIMARDIQIAVVCAYLAVKDSGLVTRCILDRGEADAVPTVDPSRFAINIGAGLICADLTELAGALETAAAPDGSFSLKKWGAEGMTNLTPLWLLKFLPNMLACHVTIVHDAQAPSNTITCGEASSHLAIGEGFRTIARGAADVCLCGGAESKANPMALARPTLCGRLNTDANHAPHAALRPFDPKAKGTVVSEGGGLVVLESLDHAKKRGARVYAELVGFGSSVSAATWSAEDPAGTHIGIAINKALADANAAPGDVGVIGTFGMGIAGFDGAERAAWGRVFGDRLAEVPAIATKGCIGQCGAGAGAIDFAINTLALSSGTVPPSLNADSRSGFKFAGGDPTDAQGRFAVTCGHAVVGGQAAALVLKRYEE